MLNENVFEITNLQINDNDLMNNYNQYYAEHDINDSTNNIQE